MADRSFPDRAGGAALPPTISINTLSLAPAPFPEQVEAVARLGAPAIGPGVEEVAACGADAAHRLIRDAGLRVGLLTHRAFGYVTPQVAAAERERLNRTIDLAQAIGAGSICMTTGGRGELGWTEAVQRYAAEIAPCVEHARQAGVTLGLEPTSHLYADISIVHRLSDVVTVAKAAGVGVGMDLFCCWMDPDLDDAIAAAAPIGAFVQLSDYVLGDRGLPCRAVLGDGAARVDRQIDAILQAGYRGVFDIEVIGPRIEAEGHEAGLKRCIAFVQAAFDRAAAPAG
jgi:sugar phosphate isomerase/epimerase